MWIIIKVTCIYKVFLSFIYVGMNAYMYMDAWADDNRWVLPAGTRVFKYPTVGYPGMLNLYPTML